MKMKGYLKAIAYTELAFGTIGSFMKAGEAGSEIYGRYKEINWGVAFIAFIGYMLMVGVGFVLLYAIHEILDNQEQILQRLGRTTQTTPEPAPSNEDNLDTSWANNHQEPEGDLWTCWKCGDINKSYEVTCSCGNSK